MTTKLDNQEMYNNSEWNQIKQSNLKTEIKNNNAYFSEVINHLENITIKSKKSKNVTIALSDDEIKTLEKYITLNSNVSITKICRIVIREFIPAWFKKIYFKSCRYKIILFKLLQQ